MTDQRTLAFINLHGVLGSLQRLCAMDEIAAYLIEGQDVSVGFAVKGGPEGTLAFRQRCCTFYEGTAGCDIKLPFSSPEKFNALIDGKGTPIPTKGFLKLGFLLNEFTKLTDRLPLYLRPEPESLNDPAFFEKSTTLMFHLILDALAQIGNHDRIGRFSVSNMPEGDVKLGIQGGPSGYIHVENRKLTAVHEEPKHPTSYMEFSDIRTARALFDGQINAVASVGEGKVRIGGMISQVDNLNRILDRVALYLA